MTTYYPSLNYCVIRNLLCRLACLCCTVYPCLVVSLSCPNVVTFKSSPAAIVARLFPEK